MNKVNIAQKLKQFDELWSPRIVGQLNGQHVKLAKIKGQFDWHHHAEQDEMFLVVKGKMTLHLRDQTVELNEGEFFIVPQGVEHKPQADQETHIMLFEPVGTLNTGNIESERTIRHPMQI